MALAVPVLERNAKTEDKVRYGINSVTADEEHNARIKSTYAMLINPTAKVDEVLGRSVCADAEPAVKPVRRELFPQQPELVENARADAEIFRADSPVNRRIAEVKPVVAESAEEDENEDLVPTRTTIQYRTTDKKVTTEEGRISNEHAEKRISLSKKEKIIIAVAVSVIIALFALIIINSAIISNINADLSSLQSSLVTVKAAYSGISDEVGNYLADSERLAVEYALLNNMILG